MAARPLAGSPGTSPQGAPDGNSPSSQGHSSAAGSPFSPVSSPEWHSSPRWPQYANFGAHSTRPMHPSTLSHVTSARHGLPADDTASQDSEASLCCEAVAKQHFTAVTQSTCSFAAVCIHSYCLLARVLMPCAGWNILSHASQAAAEVTPVLSHLQFAQLLLQVLANPTCISPRYQGII